MTPPALANTSGNDEHTIVSQDPVGFEGDRVVGSFEKDLGVKRVHVVASDGVADCGRNQYLTLETEQLLRSDLLRARKALHPVLIVHVRAEFADLEAVVVVNGPGDVGYRNDLAAELGRGHRRIAAHIPKSLDDHPGTVDLYPPVAGSRRQQADNAPTRCLAPGDRTTQLGGLPVTTAGTA